MPPVVDDVLLDKLPHGEAFRFVSRVDEIEPGVSGRGVWSVKGDEGFFTGHFPGQPIVPGVLLGEALAQMSGLVALAHEKGEAAGNAFLAQLDIRLKRPVVPPAEIVLESTLTRHVRVLTQFDVKATVDGKPVALGALTLATVAGGEA
jgi:3-hydroxyacyl-[acyl-carrier-protein] dehydratase